MRIVVQRVAHASVVVEQQLISEIKKGLLVLVGIEDADNADDIKYISTKILNLRIFNDDNGVMNRSVLDVDGEVMIVSQFTLQASTAKGNRPSYIRASKGDVALPMYNKLCDEVEKLLGKSVKKGCFGQDMAISLLNDGPTTIIIDSKQKDF